MTPSTRLSRGWFLHALLLAAAFIILAWPLALNVGLAAGAVGAIIGTLIAEAMVANRYRHWVLWAFGIAVAMLGWFVARGLLASVFFASSLSPSAASHVGEMLRWSTLAVGACLILRGTALRLRVALAVEGSVAVAAVVSTVAAHRDGMIARPLEVSDWFWRQGLDPVVAFLGVGVGAASPARWVAAARSFAQTRDHSVDVGAVARGLHGQSNSQHRPHHQAEKRGWGPAAKKPRTIRTERPVRRRAAGSGQSDSQQNNDLPENNQNGHNRPAAVVVFRKDVRPAGGVFYFRHGAFSQFNGSRLVQATMAGVGPRRAQRLSVGTTARRGCSRKRGRPHGRRHRRRHADGPQPDVRLDGRDRSCAQAQSRPGAVSARVLGGVASSDRRLRHVHGPARREPGMGRPRLGAVHRAAERRALSPARRVAAI